MKLVTLMGLAWVFSVLAVVGFGASAQEAESRQAPIIDVHLHALKVTYLPDLDIPGLVYGPEAGGRPASDDANLRETLKILERHNVVKAVTSGPLSVVYRWKEAAPDRIIGSPQFPHSPDYSLTLDLARLRQDYVSGRLGAFGEVSAQYAGLSLGDPEFEPYLALAEELGIPVGVHTGVGLPSLSPRFRERLGNPLLVEEALVRHPRLKLYIMHAGYPFLEDTIALMRAYRGVYVDLSVINWVLPRAEFHEYLRRLMQAGLGNRLLFGSDQMVWPQAIGKAIEGIGSASFLSESQKRDIFCRNAARFLEIDQAICE